jgi:hypothetical protein
MREERGRVRCFDHEKAPLLREALIYVFVF